MMRGRDICEIVIPLGCVIAHEHDGHHLRIKLTAGAVERLRVLLVRDWIEQAISPERDEEVSRAN